MLEAMALKETLSNAVRTEPVLLDVDGRVFWKLNGYDGQSDILLQDMGTWNSVAPSEKWLVYADEQKLEVEKYIISSRTKRLRVQKIEVKVGNFHSLIDPWPMASGDFGFFFAFFVAWHDDDDESSFFQMKYCCISPSL
ncbi:hypothetical protein OIU78_023444 [Salix suchowensis]|nr:hypothetical protein OIU78_023444 [Salix suchowensis]